MTSPSRFLFRRNPLFRLFLYAILVIDDEVYRTIINHWIPKRFRNWWTETRKMARNDILREAKKMKKHIWMQRFSYLTNHACVFLSITEHTARAILIESERHPLEPLIKKKQFHKHKVCNKTVKSHETNSNLCLRLNQIKRIDSIHCAASSVHVAMSISSAISHLLYYKF